MGEQWEYSLLMTSYRDVFFYYRDDSKQIVQERVGDDPLLCLNSLGDSGWEMVAHRQEESGPAFWLKRRWSDL